MRPHDLFNTIKATKYFNAGLRASYVIRYQDGTLYILFEQSNGLLDWIMNCMFLPLPVKAYKNMEKTWREHLGFRLVYDSIRDRLIDEVRMMLDQLEVATGKRPGIFCGGWSHGGALAQKAAEDIGFSLGIKADINTFGSPLLFYGDAPEIIIDRVGTVTLYKRRGDFVTELPPKSLGFRPLVPETEIGEDEYKTLIQKIANIRKTHTGYGNPELY